MFYGTPTGITKEILSANSPHWARFNWNITIHVIHTTAHMIAPIAEKITSERGQNKTQTLYLNLNLHRLICFCSSYSGAWNASLKNQMAFTAHINGNRAKPATRHF